MNRKVQVDNDKLNSLIDNFDLLSDREFEVVGLLSKQMSSKQIAEKLCISSHTVDSHRRKIISKLGLADTKCLQLLKLN